MVMVMDMHPTSLLRKDNEVKATKLFIANCEQSVFHLDMTSTESDMLNTVEDIPALVEGTRYLALYLVSSRPFDNSQRPRTVSSQTKK